MSERGWRPSTRTTPGATNSHSNDRLYHSGGTDDAPEDRRVGARQLPGEETKPLGVRKNSQSLNLSPDGGWGGGYFQIYQQRNSGEGAWPKQIATGRKPTRHSSPEGEGCSPRKSCLVSVAVLVRDGDGWHWTTEAAPKGFPVGRHPNPPGIRGGGG